MSTLYTLCLLGEQVHTFLETQVTVFLEWMC